MTQEGPSRYGYVFDKTVDTWAVLETEHDNIHPNRSDCGGLGACTMMRAAHDVKARMMDELEMKRREGRLGP